MAAACVTEAFSITCAVHIGDYEDGSCLVVIAQ